MRDFATRVMAVIDTLDFDQKQALLRLIVEDVHVTGWHVQIRLRIPLDDNQPAPRSLKPQVRHHGQLLEPDRVAAVMIDQPFVDGADIRAVAQPDPQQRPARPGRGRESGDPGQCEN